MGVVHPRRFVDPAAHRHRCLLLVEFRSPSSPANRLPSSRQRRSNTETGSMRAKPNKASCNSPRRSRPTSSKPFDALATASRWLDDTSPAAKAVSKPGICSHTSERSDAAFVSPRRTTPVPRQHLGRRFRATLGGQLARPAGDRHIDRIHPAPHPLRQLHHPTQTGAITTATSTANNPAIASPTPRSSITQPLSIDTINQGEAGHQPP